MDSEISIPRIGITTGIVPAWRAGGKYYARYARAISRAGGLPVPLGLQRRGRIDDCDGILITGGEDVHPRHYDRRPGDECLSFDDLKKKYSMTWEEPRDDYELPLAARALEMGLPILAVCRGFQVINIVLGGRLVPDISVCLGSRIAHKSGINGVPAWHDVEIGPDSRLGRLLPGPVLRVNSYHHQGLLAEDVAPGLRSVAAAPDGVIEAVEGVAHPWLVAVQWHPEKAQDRSIHQACKPLFEQLVRRAMSNEQ